MATICAARGQRLAPIVAGVGVGLAAFAWLHNVNPPFFIQDDGIRDQLLMRDCTDLGRCHLIGANSSFQGIRQGPLWLDLLIGVRLLGGDTASARTVVLALIALSVATLFVVVWRWLRAPIALPAAVLLIGALGKDIYPSMLVNPSASALPDVLTASGLLCYGLSGQRRFLIASAFALAVAINVHVGALSLVAPLLAIAALARPRPWRQVLAALALLFATYLLTSSAALRANVLALAEHGRLLPAFAAGLVLILLSAACGPRFRRQAWNARAWMIGAILVLPFALASVWIVVRQHHHFSIMYLHPVLAPAAVIIAAVLCLPFELVARRAGALRWIPTAASLVAIALAALHVSQSAPKPYPPEASPWTPADADAIAAAAAARGWSYEDMVFHVQARACRELLVGMSVAAPPPRSAPRPDRRQLQVVKVTGEPLAALPYSDDVVSLGPATAAVMRDIESWLRPESLRACRRPIGTDGPTRCAPASPGTADERTAERFLFITRSYPDIHSLDMLPPYVAMYEIPLSPGLGESRDLTVTDTAPDGGWRITRAEGVRVEGELPARQVRLHSDTGGPGLLVIERTFSAPHQLDMRYPPCLFEAPPGDPLYALVEAR